MPLKTALHVPLPQESAPESGDGAGDGEPGIGCRQGDRESQDEDGSSSEAGNDGRGPQEQELQGEAAAGGSGDGCQAKPTGAKQNEGGQQSPGAEANDAPQSPGASARDHGDEQVLDEDMSRDSETPEERALRDKVHFLQPLLQRLRGHLERGRADAVTHPSGVPRGWARPDTLAGMEDSDPVESYLWCANPIPEMPRTARRMRPGASGRVAILRDTSESMNGIWNLWAQLLCQRVMELSQQHKMRVGYVEFNSKAQKYVDERLGEFFTREYDRMTERVSRVKCEGFTNYEAPLTMALDEFECELPRHRRIAALASAALAGDGAAAARRKPRISDQHILFITDGKANYGDRTVSKEIARAQALGVSVHTVFIGYSQVPQVLDCLSQTTHGSRFAAYFDAESKGIKVIDRDEIDLATLFAASGKENQLRMLDRMTRAPPVFQRYLMKNRLVG